MRYFKTYRTKDEIVIRDKVNLFVEKMVDGIYFATKNRGGETKVFLSQSELVEKLNSLNSVAIKDKENIEVYSMFMDDLNSLIASSRPKTRVYLKPDGL